MKKSVETSYRVIVEPRALGNFGCVHVSDNFFGQTPEEIQKDYKERCEEIVADIKRHVDNVGCVYTESETENVCSFCGTNWTEESEIYNGGCCDEDEKNNPNKEVLK